MKHSRIGVLEMVVVVVQGRCSRHLARWIREAFALEPRRPEGCTHHMSNLTGPLSCQRQIFLHHSWAIRAWNRTDYRTNRGPDDGLRWRLGNIGLTTFPRPPRSTFLWPLSVARIPRNLGLRRVRRYWCGNRRWDRYNMRHSLLVCQPLLQSVRQPLLYLQL